VITTFVLFVIIMVVFLFGGIWVGAALGLSGFLALLATLGLDRTISVVGSQIWGMSTAYGLVCLPLYILMGEILHHGKFVEEMYDKATKLISGLPGGLIQSNIVVCTIFAACSGSSIASAATIGSVAYSEQVKRGYDKKLILGSIAAGGTLGILIPPSTIMILYGALVGESIGQLFIGGVIPGLILASMFSIVVVVWVLLKSSVTPPIVTRVTLKERVLAGLGLWKVALLVSVVLGGIYSGVATPTESAGLGAVMALIITVAFRKLSWNGLTASLSSTLKTTSMVVLVTTGAKIFSASLVHYSIPSALSNSLNEMGLGPMAILVIVTIMYAIMGMFVDGVSMLVLTLGFVAPIMSLAGFNMVWFGIYLTILVELSLITPPVALNLYVLQGISKEPLGLVARGAVPFIIPMLIIIVLLIAFPQLALWMPSLMIRH
jgi:C4-dicarboxylate transporter DctM subunit